MKRVSGVLPLLVVLCLCLQDQSVKATERTIEHTTWAGNTYEVYVNASDTWQIGTLLEVTVRLTLVQMDIQDKGVEYVTYSSYYWNPRFLELAVSGGKDTTSSGGYPIPWAWEEWIEPVNFTKADDHWEKKFSLKMSSWAATKLERGETANARLGVGFSLDEYGANHTLLNEPGLDISTSIAVFRPFLSTIEAIAVSGAGAFMIVGLLAFAFYKLGWISFCRWGYHDWKDCGERVIVHWTDPGIIVPASRKPSIVFSERTCSRCGLMQKRKFSRSRDGFVEVAGVEDVGFTHT